MTYAFNSVINNKKIFRLRMLQSLLDKVHGSRFEEEEIWKKHYGALKASFFFLTVNGEP